jgi:hypothetical protein
VLKIFGVPECTYIDADLSFFSDPTVLISEMLENGKNVLISEHRFSLLPKLYEQGRSGRFCVQFMTFTNQNSSLKVLEEWRRQCIDWCYAKHEDGKFGDQKYLDVWPEKYENVHILQHNGGGLAPWNIRNYKITYLNNIYTLFEKKTKFEFSPVFFHYQFVKSLGNGYYDIGWYKLGNSVKNSFYANYLIDLEKTERQLTLIKNYNRNFSELKSYLSWNPVKIFLKKILKYNILKVKVDGIPS